MMIGCLAATARHNVPAEESVQLIVISEWDLISGMSWLGEQNPRHKLFEPGSVFLRPVSGRQIHRISNLAHTAVK